MRRIPLIEQHYQQILDEKMQDLPIINSALDVKAIGFRDLDGQLLGVVITPWFMNLFLLTDELEGWRSDQTGDRHFQSFPAGQFDFVHAWDAKIGAYGTSSLFSPMDDFPNQESAEKTAIRALEQLFVEREPVAGEESPEQADVTPVVADYQEEEPVKSEPRKEDAPKPSQAQPDEDVDERRRGLLFGSLFGRR